MPKAPDGAHDLVLAADGLMQMLDSVAKVPYRIEGLTELRGLSLHKKAVRVRVPRAQAVARSPVRRVLASVVAAVAAFAPAGAESIEQETQEQVEAEIMRELKERHN